MKAIMLMFDSLNRLFLPNYGCDWTIMPNFKRLQEKTLTFDAFYGGSMPCMPARRELHTGRYNFLHRSWSPLEPFDESVFSNMKKKGVYSHIVTDHFHYLEDGGSGYLTKYDSFEAARGQQGDPWIGQVERPIVKTISQRVNSENFRHDAINRKFIDCEEKMPQYKVVENGLDFMERNCKADNWFLQIECFDPHEPFFTQQKYKDLYKDLNDSIPLDWPDYGKNEYDKATEDHLRLEYSALLSMCDAYLGKVLDKMDELNLWKDTMFIVNTDHGFLLGEHEYMGKNVMPWYDELIHIPFFIYDPRNPDCKNERRLSFAQTIDIAPTLTEFYNLEPLQFADGKSMTPIIENDSAVRECGLFGLFGGYVNVTDGRYVYMRAPAYSTNEPLFEYTLAPSHMNNQFKPSELKEMELVDLPFAKGAKVLKIPAKAYYNPFWDGNKLFDLKTDRNQTSPIKDEKQELKMLTALREGMIANFAPIEQYERLGFAKEGELTTADLYPKENSIAIPNVNLNLTAKALKALAITASYLTEDVVKKIIDELEAKYANTPEVEVDENAFLEIIKKYIPIQMMFKSIKSMVL